MRRLCSIHQTTRTPPDCLVRPTIHRISRSPRSPLAAPLAPLPAEHLAPHGLPADPRNLRQPAATGTQPGQRSRRVRRPGGPMRASPTRASPMRVHQRRVDPRGVSQPPPLDHLDHPSPRVGLHIGQPPVRTSPLRPRPSRNPGARAEGAERGRQARTGRTRRRRVSHRTPRTEPPTRRPDGGCSPNMGRCARTANGSSNRR